jgi:hypothetical protein
VKTRSKKGATRLHPMVAVVVVVVVDEDVKILEIRSNTKLYR